MKELDLLELKEKIDTAKTKVAELIGSEKQLKKELKEKWKCNSVKEAETKLTKMEKEIEKLTEQITEGTEELQKKYLNKEDE